MTIQKKHNFVKLAVTSLSLLLIVGSWAYYFPYQKHLAYQSITTYMHKQNIPSNDIKTMKFIKDFKQDGYMANVTLRDDPSVGYQYTYSPIFKNDYKHVILGCFLDNFGYGIDKGMKYPPLK